MIKHFSDQAANERTYLAWVRTAVAVMGFGFLVEKFDLFLQIQGGSQGGHVPGPVSQLVGEIAGLLLLLLGGIMMVAATMRFRRLTADIDSEEQRPLRGETEDTVLVGSLLALGMALFGYLLFTTVRHML